MIIIAGPCTIEGLDHALRHAEALWKVVAPYGYRFFYKSSYDKANRSSINSYRGLGMDEGLRILEEVKTQIGVEVLTDFHTPQEAAPVAEVADVLQIPAFLCRQTDMLLAAAETGRIVNVKKGQFVAPHDMKNVAAKLEHGKAKEIWLTERGTMFGYNNLIVDFRSLPIMRSFGHPVIFDATHSVQRPGGLGTRSGGDRTEVPGLIRCACAIGVDGIFMEVHEDPDNAPSDGPNMLRLDDMDKTLAMINAYSSVDS